MHFTKYHGLGNDYLYCYTLSPEGAPANASELSLRLSDRHFGCGSDGMIWISPVTDPTINASFRMRMFNADGSEGSMCGNGIRCVAKYVYDKGYTKDTHLNILTKAGIKALDLEVIDGKVNTVTVDMGKAIVSEDVTLQVTPFEGAPYSVTCTPVDMGNPHAVVFVKDAHAVDLKKEGAPMEKHPFFKDGVNTEFTEIVSDHFLRMRVWERGSGITLACGTGTCACTAAAVRHGFCPIGDEIRVELAGGDLFIRILENGHAIMRGPATFVYEGEIPDCELC